MRQRCRAAPLRRSGGQRGGDRIEVGIHQRTGRKLAARARGFALSGEHQPGLRASRRGGHTPHLLQEAFAWHLRFENTGSMLEQQRQPEAVPA